MPDAKICGITTPEALDAAIEGGARFVGFVTYPKSPRFLTQDKLAALARRAAGRVETVLVTVAADDAHLVAAIEAAQPDWIQLHGGEAPGRVAEVRRFARRGVIKAMGVGRREDLMAASAYEPVADMLLFDAQAPSAAAQPGGNAMAFDWSLLGSWTFGRPWLLAGGLTPVNVREAIRVSGADLVDVSSGVESAPGLKDPLLIAQFLAAVEV
ncbi:phosphoribosylanthranilate isomerase [Terricaulis silvestris]|uniref:N-(5'-phosphoribosyl)anthranilate isomerase n=1 Tax=Terricaulis silvestris TaxID=2686094 RepID=A0A6I6MMD9_9CAUL|nr:phosphoribosylanthranilate isomerase [Terricaulis silvestris]QGZ96645.1 N-(5'-phosphoribosyl)anthranilate isomerase [Terricaulis silvestris]